MINRVTNTFPVLGGVGGAWSQIDWHNIVTAEGVISFCLLTTLGVLIGWFGKKALDYIAKTIHDYRSR